MTKELPKKKDLAIFPLLFETVFNHNKITHKNLYYNNKCTDLFLSIIAATKTSELFPPDKLKPILLMPV